MPTHVFFCVNQFRLTVFLSFTTRHTLLEPTEAMSSQGSRCIHCSEEWTTKTAPSSERVLRDSYRCYTIGQPFFFNLQWDTKHWRYITCLQCLAKITKAFIEENEHKGLLWILANIREYRFWEYEGSVNVMLQWLVGIQAQEGLAWQLVWKATSIFGTVARALARGETNHMTIASLMQIDVKEARRTAETRFRDERETFELILTNVEKALEPYLEKPLQCRLRSGKQLKFVV